MEVASRRLNRSGFTLIELLVVITIISLLMAILLPALKKLRQAAQSIVCMSQARQMGLALHAYQAEYGHLVSGSDLGGTTGSRWFNALDVMMGGQDFISANYNKIERPKWQVCPTRDILTPSRNTIGYGWNYSNFGHEYAFANPSSGSYSAGPPVGKGWNAKLHHVVKPAHTVIIADAMDFMPSNDRENYKLYQIVGSGINSRWPRRHAGGGNWLYVDGHARTHTPEALAAINSVENVFYQHQ